MKRIVSLLLTVLIIVPTFTQINVFGAENTLSYTKNPTAYTVSNQKYYLATLKSDYNGVKAGAEFFVDSSGNVVTDKILLGKLNTVNIFNKTNFNIVELCKNTASDLYHSGTVSSYVECCRKWINNGQAANYLGSATVSAIKIMFDTATQNYSETVDGIIDLSIGSFKSVASAQLALVSSGVIKAAAYANQFNYHAPKVSKYPAQMYDYEQLEDFFSDFSASQASFNTVKALCDATMSDILSEGTGFWAGVKVTFRNLTEGVISSAFSAVNDMFLYLDDDTYTFVDDAIADLYELGQTNLHTNVSSFYGKEYSSQMDTLFYGFLTASNEIINTHSKLSKKSISTSSYSTGTYKPSEWNGLNIRSGASTSNSIVGAIASGTTFVVTKVTGNWGYTTCNGKSGWVCLDYATYVNTTTATTSSSTSSKYNAAAAIEYGKNHWNDGKGLCAEFVSDCLKAGGSSAWYVGCTTLVKQLQEENWGTLHKLNVNSNGTISLEKNKNILSPGDPIFVYSSGCLSVDGKPYVHAYLYYDTDSNGNLKGYAHNNASNSTIDVYFTCAYCNKPTDAAYVFHMNNSNSSASINKEQVNFETESITEGTYVLNCIVKSYRYLTAKTDSNGSQVEAKPFENIDAQKFDIVKSGNGYKIISKSSSSGRVISGYNDGANQTVGNVTLANPSSSSSQVWLLKKEGDCYIIYPSFNTSLALTSTDTGRVVVSTYTGEQNQLWKLAIQNTQPEKYTITYNANGGIDVPDSQTKTQGENIILTTKEPTREGYIFIGWSKSKGGKAEYISGVTFAEDKDITLYAVWQEDKKEAFYVIYNANGGSNAPDMQTKTENENLVLSTAIPEKEGYSFEGWSVKNNDKIYKPGDIYTDNKTVQLLAIWKANTYTVSYNANGGTNAPSSQIKTHAIPIILSKTTPIKENFEFVCWTDGSKEYLGGDIFEKDENIILSAVYKEIDKKEEFPFVDVPEDAWYRKDVENAHEKGLINGKGENKYSPDDNMTYAEAIKLACTIYQLHYDGEVTLKNGSETWYSTFMEYALNNRIIRADYSAVANESITRRDFVNIFYGALPLSEFIKINEIEDNIIPDVKITDAYSAEIYTFYRAGILTGSDYKGSFMPTTKIKRSEVAAIITRMLDKGSRKAITLK